MPTQPVEETINTRMFSALVEGGKAGVAAQITNELVDGVIAAFHDVPMFTVMANTPLGRSVLGIAVPWGVAVLAATFPGLMPVDAKKVEAVARYAVQGHATTAVQPLVARLVKPIREVVGKFAGQIEPPTSPVDVPPATPQS